MTLNICEIFYSLQGESTFAGLPCIFIRLSGCNLSCEWCDTPYSKEESRPMETDQVLDAVRPFNCRLVEVTGGEPLIQEKTPGLIRQLIRQGYTVLLETNGSLSLAPVPEECIKIMDIKCPSSGEQGSFLFDNIHHLTCDDEIKFVIGSREDYEFAKHMILENLTGIQPSKTHLSPVFGQISPEAIADWMLKDNLPARLSLQQHKIIWAPDTRGV